MFNKNQTRYDFARSVIAIVKKFTGVQIYMSTNMGDTGSVTVVPIDINFYQVYFTFDKLCSI